MHALTQTHTMISVNSVRRRKCYTAEASDTDHNEWEKYIIPGADDMRAPVTVLIAYMHC